MGPSWTVEGLSACWVLSTVERCISRGSIVAIVEEGLPRGSRHRAVGEAEAGGVVEGDSVNRCVDILGKKCLLKIGLL